MGYPVREVATLDSAAIEVLLPILRETGDRWEAGTFTVAHEHAVGSQARGLMDTLLRLAAPHPGEARRFDDVLQRLGERCEVWVGLPPDHGARDRVEGARYFHRFEDLDLALTERAAQAES